MVCISCYCNPTLIILCSYIAMYITCYFLCGSEGFWIHIKICNDGTFIEHQLSMWLSLQKHQPYEHKNLYFLLYILLYKHIYQNCRIQWGFFRNLKRQNSTFKTEDISKNITRCNLLSHGLYPWSLVWLNCFSDGWSD